MSQYESYPKGPDGQQNPYGQPNPYDPSAYGSPASAGTVARPQSVALAVKLIFGAVALSVVSAVIALLTIDDQVRAQAETAGVDPDTVRTIALVTVLVVVVLTVVIFTVLALLINRGKNWARIVYTILGALSVLSLGTSFNGEVIAASLVVEIVQALLTIGAIVLLFRDEARPFFASR